MLDVFRYCVLMKSNQDRTAKQEKLMVHLMQLCLNNSHWICLQWREWHKKKASIRTVVREKFSNLLWPQLSF